MIGLADLKESEWPSIEPPQLPVTIRDMEMADGCFDMSLHMADPCPRCEGFRMRVGDYACWGLCWICFEELDNDYQGGPR